MATVVLQASGEAPPGLYLVATYAGQYSGMSYGAALVKVSPDGEASLATELVPKSEGVRWAVAIPEIRKMVIVSGSPVPRGFSVLDFDEAKLTKECKLPDAPRGLQEEERWITASPWRLPALTMLFSRPDAAEVRAVSISLDPSKGCSPEREPVNNALEHITVSGLAGSVVGHDPSVIRYVDLEPGGKIFAEVAPGKKGERVLIGSVPPSMIRRSAKSDGCDVYTVLVNSGQATVLSQRCTRMSPEKPEYYVLDKGRGAWRRMPVNGLFAFRGFGGFVAGVEFGERPKGHRAMGRAVRPKQSDYGPDPVSVSIDRPGALFPGVLVAYDIRTEQTP